MHLRAHRNIERALQDVGMPRLDWYDVLWALECAPVGLRPYQKQEALLFEQSDVSRLAMRLEKEGLIIRRKDKTDGRGLVLHITDQGKALRGKIWPVYRQAIDQEMRRASEQTNCLTALLDLPRK